MSLPALVALAALAGMFGTPSDAMAQQRTLPPEEREPVPTREALEAGERSMSQYDEQMRRVSQEQMDSALRQEERTYQVAFRTWAIKTPSFVLGGIFARHTDHWDGQANLAFGGEFTYRRPESLDLVFSIDWADTSMPEGFWLEDGDPVLDADWTDQGTSLLSGDVSVRWVTPLYEGWDLYYGIGLGASIVLGEVKKWDVDPACLSDPASESDTEQLDDGGPCFDDEGEPRLADPDNFETEDRIPPILPAFSGIIGTRWTIQDNWVVSLETGLKTIYFYGGLSLGYTWTTTVDVPEPDQAW